MIIGPFGSWPENLQQAFDAFTAKTGVQVEVLVATGWPDLFDKVVTMSAAGVPPDVVYADNLRSGELAETGLLMPLDALAETNGLDLGRYPQPVLDGLTFGGKLFSLPTAVSIHAMFYNADLFAESGLNDIPIEWTADGLGWDEFVSIAKALTRDSNGDGTPDNYGLHGFGYSGGFNMIGLWGAQDVDRERTRYLGTDPSVIRALEFSTSLWTEHNVVGGNFIQETAAMAPIQVYYLNNLLNEEQKGNHINWRVGILPKGDVRVSQASFHSLGITKGASDSKGAWELITFLAYDPQGTVLFTRAENRVPVIKEASMDFVERWNEQFPGRHVELFTQAVQVLWDWRIISGRGASEILRLETEAWNEIHTGESSVREAIEAIAPRVNAALQGD